MRKFFLSLCELALLLPPFAFLPKRPVHGAINFSTGYPMALFIKNFLLKNVRLSAAVCSAAIAMADEVVDILGSFISLRLSPVDITLYLVSPSLFYCYSIN